MTVQQLIDLLGECDPDATVRIMMQENWPFECELEGIAIREEFAGEACECDRSVNEPHEGGCPAEDEGEGLEDADIYGDGLKGNDVFLVEGRQERYGDKSAWAAARRW
jgi:hypothetical protein